MLGIRIRWEQLSFSKGKVFNNKVTLLEPSEELVIAWLNQKDFLP
jgi:hypothetical protein